METIEKEFNYEDAIKELELIVKKIEKGEITFNKLSEDVKKATELLKKCREKLKSSQENLLKQLK